MSSAKIRLPILVERSIVEATVARTQLGQDYEDRLRSKVREGGASITCTKGCNHCCYHPVMVTLFEGITIYRWLAANHLWTAPLKERLETATDQVKGLSVEVWLLSAIPCPLLTKDGLCSVYPARPYSCRITYSVGDPHYCHPHRLGDATGILPKKEMFEILGQVETGLLRQHQLPHFRIPLAKAVLYGERVVKGELELEDCMEALL